MPIDSGPPSDFQRSTRMPLDAVVRLHFQGTVAYQNGFAANVSASGMFVKHPDPPPVGTRLVFEFTIGSQRRPCQGTGEVVWVREKYEGPGRPAGSGIRFVDLDELSRQHLTEALFEFLEASLGDRMVENPEVQAMVASMPTHAPIEQAATIEAVEPPAIEVEPEPPQAAPAPPAALSTETVRIPVTTRDSIPGATPFRIFDDDVPLPDAAATTAPPTPIEPPPPAPEQLPALPSFESPAIPAHEAYRVEGDETMSIYGAAGVGPRRSGSRWLGPTLGIVALAALAGGGWWYWTQYRPAQVAAGAAKPPAAAASTSAPATAPAPPAAATAPAEPPLRSRLGPGRTLVESVGATQRAPDAQLPAAGPRPSGEAAEDAATPAETPAAAAAAKPPATEPAPPASAPAIGAVQASVVHQIGAVAAAGRTVVTIVGDGGFPVGSFTWSEIGGDKPRVLVRLKAIEEAYHGSATGLPTPELAGIRTGYHLASGGNELHIVLDLVPSVRARVDSVEPSGDTLVVTLKRP
jgi:uncharacterized protein (TIGR02266 family)